EGLVGLIENQLSALQRLDISDNRQEAVALSHEQLDIRSKMVDTLPGEKAFEYQIVKGQECLVSTLMIYKGADQGNRTSGGLKCEEDVLHLVQIPSGGEAFAADVVFDGGVRLQNRQCQATEHGSNF